MCGPARASHIHGPSARTCPRVGSAADSPGPSDDGCRGGDGLWRVLECLAGDLQVVLDTSLRLKALMAQQHEAEEAEQQRRLHLERQQRQEAQQWHYQRSAGQDSVPLRPAAQEVSHSGATAAPWGRSEGSGAGYGIEQAAGAGWGPQWGYAPRHLQQVPQLHAVPDDDLQQPSCSRRTFSSAAAGGPPSSARPPPPWSSSSASYCTANTAAPTQPCRSSAAWGPPGSCAAAAAAVSDPRPAVSSRDPRRPPPLPAQAAAPPPLLAPAPPLHVSPGSALLAGLERQVEELVDALGGPACSAHVVPHAQELMGMLAGQAALVLCLPAAAACRLVRLLGPLLPLHGPLLGALLEEASEMVAGAAAAAAASRRAARLKLLCMQSHPGRSPAYATPGRVPLLANATPGQRLLHTPAASTPGSTWRGRGGPAASSPTSMCTSALQVRSHILDSGFDGFSLERVLLARVDDSGSTCPVWQPRRTHAHLQANSQAQSSCITSRRPHPRVSHGFGPPPHTSALLPHSQIGAREPSLTTKPATDHHLDPDPLAFLPVPQGGSIWTSPSMALWADDASTAPGAVARPPRFGAQGLSGLAEQASGAPTAATASNSTACRAQAGPCDLQQHARCCCFAEHCYCRIGLWPLAIVACVAYALPAGAGMPAPHVRVPPPPARHSS